MLFESWLTHSEGLIRRAAVRTGWTFSSRTVTRYGSIYVDYERQGESFREELRVRLADHVGRAWLRQLQILWDRPDTVTRALNAFAWDRYPRGYKFTDLRGRITESRPSAAVGRPPTQNPLWDGSGVRSGRGPDRGVDRLGARHYWQSSKGVVDVQR